jgi:hypothetical protein
MPTQTVNSNSLLLNKVDYQYIEDEILHFLRKNLTDRLARATLGTETFTATTGQQSYTLTGDLDTQNRHKIMYISSLTVNGVVKTIFKDFICGFRNDSPILGKIYFTNPLTLGDVVIINYYHTYSWIFTEMPRVDLTSKSYPRVSLNLNEDKIENASIGGLVQKHTISIIISVVDLTKNQVQNVIKQIKNLILVYNTQFSFQTFFYIIPNRVSKMEEYSDDKNDIVFKQDIELQIMDTYDRAG